jgi:DNA-binding response OmpR family regulator
MSHPCPTCGHYSQKDVVHSSLRVQQNPFAAYWHGKRLANLNPSELKILKALARGGLVSHFELSLAIAESKALTPIVKVYISNLRKKLPAGLAIDNEHGKGYRLIVEE